MRIARCPECGGKASLYNTGEDAWIVMCQVCGHDWEPETGTKVNAIRAWNNQAKIEKESQ